MNNIILNDNIKIENMIYEIRGKQVMLDSDLAKLYEVATKRINEAVRNNNEKFPERYSWILAEDEWFFLRSKFSTLKSNISGKGHHRKYLPRVFTEQGVYMLATILKSKVAVDVSLAIMDTFVKMRHYINYTKDVLPYKYMLLEQKVDNNTARIDELFDKFDCKDIAKNYLFFENDFYDAYSTLIDILNTSKKEIIIIDNYIDKNLLDILKGIDRRIIIITNKYNNIDYQKYQEQYQNIALKINNKFHDRFIIIDKKALYHCGASLKDLGKKCFAINQIDDIEILNKLLEKV